jgi:hypothetical protein
MRCTIQYITVDLARPWLGDRAKTPPNQTPRSRRGGLRHSSAPALGPHLCSGHRRRVERRSQVTRSSDNADKPAHDASRRRRETPAAAALTLVGDGWRERRLRISTSASAASTSSRRLHMVTRIGGDLTVNVDPPGHHTRSRCSRRRARGAGHRLARDKRRIVLHGDVLGSRALLLRSHALAFEPGRPEPPKHQAHGGGLPQRYVLAHRPALGSSRMIGPDELLHRSVGQKPAAVVGDPIGIEDRRPCTERSEPCRRRCAHRTQC